MTGEAAEDRQVWRVTGRDREEFLQGLVTNDIRRLRDGPVYAALLSAQGKYLADFFLTPGEGEILLDVASRLGGPLVRRLSMYRLRADVAITATDLRVLRGLGPAPDGAFADPRHPALGWRLLTGKEGGPAAVDWDAIRVAHCIPETGVELIPDESYILECGFERLGGVDFRKGCYVGQEVTARMKHKTGLRKGLITVRVEGAAPVGTPIEAAGKPAGVLYTQAEGRGIAYLRFDRAGEGLAAGPARVFPEPSPLPGG
ncbi:MAG: YgfZ/GcvT domain-containing protein [Paracoccaceae bacterium]